MSNSSLLRLPPALALSLFLVACGGGSKEQQHELPAGAGQPPAVEQAEPLSAEALLNWAETSYTALFPGPQVTQSWDVYQYRYYAATGNTLGVANGQVYRRAPDTGGQIERVGALADFACRVTPQACAEQLAFEVIEASLAIETSRTGVVTGEAAWGALWAEGNRNQSPPPVLPAVDFTQQMVVGVALGQRPNACYSVAVRSAYRSGGKITVEYQEYPPPPRALCAAAVAYPSQVVRMARSALPVEFVKVSSCNTASANQPCAAP